MLQVNVSVEELIKMRASNIASLICPASTVLDDSIGCAQWFAARGEGYITNELNEDHYYSSPARVRNYLISFKTRTNCEYSR